MPYDTPDSTSMTTESTTAVPRKTSSSLKTTVKPDKATKKPRTTGKPKTTKNTTTAKPKTTKNIITTVKPTSTASLGKKFCEEKQDGTYPNPKDKHSFIQCSGKTMHLIQCPGDLEYDITCTCCNWAPNKP